MKYNLEYHYLNSVFLPKQGIPYIDYCWSAKAYREIESLSYIRYMFYISKTIYKNCYPEYFRINNEN